MHCQQCLEIFFLIQIWREKIINKSVILNISYKILMDGFTQKTKQTFNTRSELSNIKWSSYWKISFFININVWITTTKSSEVITWSYKVWKTKVCGLQRWILFRRLKQKILKRKVALEHRLCLFLDQQRKILLPKSNACLFVCKLDSTIILTYNTHTSLHSLSYISFSQ